MASGKEVMPVTKWDNKPPFLVRNQSLWQTVFAGEYGSTDFKGFMNDAAETSRMTADSVFKTTKA
jgi:hypothetical protein